MDDFVDSANEELKRADHLIFVSLKYTRTCDVLKHIVDRFINCIDFCFSAVLEQLKEEGKIDEVPKAPIVKANRIKELFPDDPLFMDFAVYFVKLRKISKADFSRACEFRRHVTMTVEVDGEKVEIDIDSVTEDFKKLKELYAKVDFMINPSEQI